MITNESSALKCVACESPNPNASNAKSQEKESAKVSGITFGSSNITFGSQTPATLAAADKETKEAASAPQSAASMFSGFALQSGQWKCPVCMITNESSALKCVACESPNPNASNAKSQEKES